MNHDLHDRPSDCGSLPGQRAVGREGRGSAPARGVSRRQLLRGLIAAGIGPLAPTTAGAEEREPGTLVVCFLRGGLDGLSTVIPHFEDAYYRYRPHLAQVTPLQARRLALDLDGRFALHPALGGLRPAFREGELAVVHAVGLAEPIRSHFDAQDYVDLGHPPPLGATGWLARAAHAASLGPAPLSVVALEDALPVSLWGATRAVATGPLSSFRLDSSRREQALLALVRALHSSGRSEWSEQFDAAFRLRDRIQFVQSTQARRPLARRYPKGAMGQSLFDLASLMRAGVAPRIATLSWTGWDTHVSQTRTLERKLAVVAQGLLALRADLGERFAQVTLVLCTEFGRTARENGTGGTDHGRGSAMLLYGGQVAGGRVFGRWPGLEVDQLSDGRDLAVTTDFRDVFSEVAERALGLPPTPALFPGYRPTALGVLRGGMTALPGPE